MDYLNFELSEGDDGISTLQAVASLAGPALQALALAEAQQVLDWAWQQFPHSHGPVEEGGDWDHELHQQQEAGGWHSLALTLSASPRFVQAFTPVFGLLEDQG